MGGGDIHVCLFRARDGYFLLYCPDVFLRCAVVLPVSNTCACAEGLLCLSAYCFLGVLSWSCRAWLTYPLSGSQRDPSHVPIDTMLGGRLADQEVRHHMSNLSEKPQLMVKILEVEGLRAKCLEPCCDFLHACRLCAATYACHRQTYS